MAMTRWKTSCRWVLVAAMAVQFSGCAQTSQWVSRWSGRDKDDEQVAELDGRDDAQQSEKSIDKVKVASSGDAAQKRKPKAPSKDDDAVVAKPKSKKPADSLIAKAPKKARSSQDPFLAEADAQPVPRKNRRTANDG